MVLSQALSSLLARFTLCCFQTNGSIRINGALCFNGSIHFYGTLLGFVSIVPLGTLRFLVSLPMRGSLMHFDSIFLDVAVTGDVSILSFGALSMDDSL